MSVSTRFCAPTKSKSSDYISLNAKHNFMAFLEGHLCSFGCSKFSCSKISKRKGSGTSYGGTPVILALRDGAGESFEFKGRLSSPAADQRLPADLSGDRRNWKRTQGESCGWQIYSLRGFTGWGSAHSHTLCARVWAICCVSHGLLTSVMLVHASTLPVCYLNVLWGSGSQCRESVSELGVVEACVLCASLPCCFNALWNRKAR